MENKRYQDNVFNPSLCEFDLSYSWGLGIEFLLLSLAKHASNLGSSELGSTAAFAYRHQWQILWQIKTTGKSNVPNIHSALKLFQPCKVVPSQTYMLKKQNEDHKKQSHTHFWRGKKKKTMIEHNNETFWKCLKELLQLYSKESLHAMISFHFSWLPLIVPRCLAIKFA